MRSFREVWCVRAAMKARRGPALPCASNRRYQRLTRPYATHVLFSGRDTHRDQRGTGCIRQSLEIAPDDVIDMQAMTYIVLWPVDLQAPEGVFYGWTRPLVCVAGALPTTDRAVSSFIGWLREGKI